MSANAYNFVTNPHSLPLDLKGKVAIVTGGGSGIGAGISHALAQHGVNVVINGRREDKLLEVAEQIRQNGGQVEVYAGDISLEETSKKLVAFAVSKFGALHIAVFNGGTHGVNKIVNYTADDLDRLLNTNIKGVVYGMKYALPVIGKYSTKYEQGVIINISSTAASTVSNRSPSSCIYASTKAFVDQLAKTGAVEAAEFNTRVNAIAPGYVHTEMTSRLKTSDAAEYDQIASKASTVGRAGGVNEIAALTIEAIRNKFINGSVLRIDGGYHVWV